MRNDNIELIWWFSDLVMLIIHITASYLYLIIDDQAPSYGSLFFEHEMLSVFGTHHLHLRDSFGPCLLFYHMLVGYRKGGFAPKS